MSETSISIGGSGGGRSNGGCVVVVVVDTIGIEVFEFEVSDDNSDEFNEMVLKFGRRF